MPLIFFFFFTGMRNLFPPRSRLEMKQKKSAMGRGGRGGASGADALFVFDPRLVNYAPLADLATGICNRGCCDDAPASQKISLPGGSDGGVRSHPPGHPFSSSAGPLNVFPICLPPQFSLSAPQKRSRGASCLAHGMGVALVAQERGQHPTSTAPGDTAQHTAPPHPRGLQQGHFLCPFLAVFKDLTQPLDATMNHKVLMSPLPRQGLCKWSLPPTEGPQMQQHFTSQSVWKTSVWANDLY